MLAWYRRHGRDLPWRRTRDPYAILVSEIMLQQTQVSRVIPKYREFLTRFPTVRALAAASLRDVLHAWSGLGYNGRARRLWASAREVVAYHGGQLPRDVRNLQELPGIGRYTAGAVVSFAFGAREAAVDTNLRRVLSRALLGSERAPVSAVWAAAQSAMPHDAATWHHALMDVGALFCRRTPQCEACPLRRVCRWANMTPAQRVRHKRLPEARQSRYQGSRREQRGCAIRALTRAPALGLRELGAQVKDGFRTTDLPWLLGLLGDLERDGLVVVDRKRKLARIA